ncbi:hypothetical protein [Streptomyces sp. NPDC059564]|uniref:hypothetical protein n=1 Tax=Streptomyces sp. NPDC059564 TaxID=3346865 RepID=UPI0036BC12E2
MRVKHSILAMAGVTAALLTASLTTGSAQAAAPAEQAPAARALTAPAAPASAGRSSVAAAVSPGISPGVNTIHVAPGGSYSCARGNLCTLVWDPTTGNWKVFYLNACHRYSVFNWEGNGAYWDQQTGNVLSTFYDAAGGEVNSFRPGGGQLGQNWSPVYSIQNC